MRDAGCNPGESGGGHTTPANQAAAIRGGRDMKLHSTLIANIKYGRHAYGMWGFFDVSDGKQIHVGPWFLTRERLILEMRPYLENRWGLSK